MTFPAGLISTLIAVKTAIAEAIDQYAKYVTLKLVAERADVSLTPSMNNSFYDSSDSAFALTSTGFPAQGSFSPFSARGWSYASLNTAYTSIASAPAASGQFCLEGSYFFVSNIIANSVLFGSTSAGGVTVYYTGTALSVRAHGGSDLLSFNWTPTLNTWHHIAVSRDSSNVIRIFVNGVLSASATTATSFTSASHTPLFSHYGQVCNYRYVVGSAIYTADFTVPAQYHTAISGTAYLTAIDGTFRDHSTNKFAVAVTGAPTVVQNSPFNHIVHDPVLHGGSIYSVNTADALSTAAAHSQIAGNLSGSPFTIEAWIFTMTTGASQVICSKRGAVVDWQFLLGTSNNLTFTSNGVTLAAIGNILQNCWNHVAVVGNGSTLTMYVNGIATNIAGSAYAISNASASPLTVSYNTLSFRGFISDVRITKGEQVYTGNFSVPTAPLVKSSNTVFLVSGAQAGISAGGNTISLGSASVLNRRSNDVSKFNGSLFFPESNGANIVGPANGIALGTGNFTIECWVNMTAVNAAATGSVLVDFRPSGINGAYPMIFINTDLSVRYMHSSVDQIISSGSVSLGQWSHIAVVRNSGTTTLFINGVANGSISDSTNYLCGLSAPVFGGDGAVRNSNRLNGYLDDIRISRVARYTAPFTPPVSSCPSTPETDSYFTLTPLLIQAEPRSISYQTASNALLTDSGPLGLPISYTGNTGQGSFSPYSNNGWATHFNVSGTSDRVTFASNAAVAFGAGTAFTIEAFVNVSSVASAMSVVSTITTGDGGIELRLNTNLTISAAGANTVIGTSTGVITLGVWNHVAITRTVDNVWKFWIDGIDAGGSTTNATAFTDTIPRIGSRIGDATGAMLGFISNVRIVSGYALYTTAFTPSTTTLTAVDGTILLSLTDNRIKDSGPLSLSSTTSGNPSVQHGSVFTETVPYSASSHGGSVYINGTTEHFNVATVNSAFTYGIGDFTIELWYYPVTAHSATSRLLGSGGMRLSVGVDGMITYSTLAGASIIAGTIPVTPLYQWHHIAISRISGLSTMYIDGAACGTATDVNNFTGNTFYVGTDAGTTRGTAGFFSDVHAIKGEGKYTAAFNPPTSPISASSKSQILIRGISGAIRNKTNYSVVTQITGSTSASRVSGAVPRNEKPAFFFSSTAGQGLRALYPRAAGPYCANIGFRNFTLEFWMNRTVTQPASIKMFGNIPGVAWANGHWTVGINSATGNLEFWVYAINSGSPALVSTLAIGSNSWNHVALVRQGNNITFFINGTFDSQLTTALAIDNGTAVSIYIGQSGSSSADGFSGYLSDIRLTNGVARYTANFIPPEEI